MSANNDQELAEELQNLNINKFKLLKSSKKKDAILYAGHYYNFKRKNKNSTSFKCRTIVDKEKKLECTGTFTFKSKDYTLRF